MWHPHSRLSAIAPVLQGVDFPYHATTPTTTSRTLTTRGQPEHGRNRSCGCLWFHESADNQSSAALSCRIEKIAGEKIATSLPDNQRDAKLPYASGTGSSPATAAPGTPHAGRGHSAPASGRIITACTRSPSLPPLPRPLALPHRRRRQRQRGTRETTYSLGLSVSPWGRARIKPDGVSSKLGVCW